MSDEEEHYMTDEKKKENLQKLEDELGYFFRIVLGKYMIGRPRTLLKRTSPNAKLILRDELQKLWIALVKINMRFKFAPYFYWEKPQSTLSIFDNAKKIENDLVEDGEHYKRFWFEKKHFEGFIEIFNKYVEENAYECTDDVLCRTFGRRNILDKNDIGTIAKIIKVANKHFIKDLKKIRADLKKSLFGLENRLKHFASVWLPYLTFAAVIILGAVQICLMLKK